MRKPRDFDADLKALEEKARELKTRKVRQLGELVITTGADTLSAGELAGALIVLVETKRPGRGRHGPSAVSCFFKAGRGEMRQQLTATWKALLRNRAARNRYQAAKARHDMRAWQVDRRKRTRHLIELGGLVVKAGLVNLTGGDRAMIYGALLWMAENSKVIEANRRERYGPPRGRKRSRESEIQKGQIQLFQQLHENPSENLGRINEGQAA